MSSRKIGFWSVFALVSGSQIGSGAFVLPSHLAPYGSLGLLGWFSSGVGAMSLALVFAYLCSKFPKTGGPHVYVEQAFGKKAAFFVGWTYWVISWVSTSVVIATSVAYLEPFTGKLDGFFNLLMEIILLVGVTFLNLKGVQSAGKAEIFLTFLKFAPLFVISGVAVLVFDSGNFSMDASLISEPKGALLAQASLTTFWGFVGVESATAAAGSVENPRKTIPRAIILGTLSVAVLYLFNSVAVMGLIPSEKLALSSAPYIDAAKLLFGGKWYLLVSLIASVVCIGTMNAWILTSGQIALGLAQDGYMPKIFARKNSKDAPFGGLIISSAGILPLLVLTSSPDLAQQINAVIDFSATSFLYVYLICAIAFLKTLYEYREDRYYEWVFGFMAAGFCSWIIWETPRDVLSIAGAFTVSGIFPYFLWYKKREKSYVWER